MRLILACFLSSIAFGQLSFQGESNGDLKVLARPSELYLGHEFIGMPYSGELVFEHMQTLADGTHIRQPRRVEKVWRDSQGRTRWERSVTLGPGQENKHMMIEIRDPVGSAYYVLDDQNRVAYRFALTAPPARQATETPKTVSTPPSAPRPETKWEKLGNQSVDGLIAEGSRATTTWPVDSFGNDRPLSSTFERWDSTELKVLLLTRNFDPRAGEETMRLTSVSRAEPDPSLFSPPDGYTVTDGKESVTLTLKKQ
jgi:hypothetical protein